MPDLIDESPRGITILERVESLEREVSRLEVAVSDANALLEMVMQDKKKDG